MAVQTNVRTDELYDEFDKIVGDVKDPITIKVLKAVWNIWDRKCVPWMTPQWGRCSFCNMPAMVVHSVVDMSAQCASCYAKNMEKTLRAPEPGVVREIEPKLDVDDFARL